MRRLTKVLLLLQIMVILQVVSPRAFGGKCFLGNVIQKSSLGLVSLKAKAIDKALDIMAAWKGLSQYLKRNEELRQTGQYLDYGNFGEMGLAEIGISVRYNQANLNTLNTGRPLIIVANHHLGIADGLALQYLASRTRTSGPSLLFLARWIEKLLPHAVYGDKQKWGTAIPVEINMPERAEAKAFNSSWSLTSAKALIRGGALIVFPAGHVASMNDDGGTYPGNISDAPNSWQKGFLDLARFGNADFIFANVDSVNSEAFYKNRKRFGGGDKERVIWFFSEALAKKGETIDVKLSKPMSLDEIYNTLFQMYGYPRETLVADPQLTAELLRQFTYKISEIYPQELDTTDSPTKKMAPDNSHSGQ